MVDETLAENCPSDPDVTSSQIKKAGSADCRGDEAQGDEADEGEAGHVRTSGFEQGNGLFQRVAGVMGM